MFPGLPQPQFDHFHFSLPSPLLAATLSDQKLKLGEGLGMRLINAALWDHLSHQLPATCIHSYMHPSQITELLELLCIYSTG